MSAPLGDVVVLALEQAVAAPFATRQFADLGARVLKVERVAAAQLAEDHPHLIAHRSVDDPQQLWEHEQRRALDRFMTVSTPTGRTTVMTRQQ